MCADGYFLVFLIMGLSSLEFGFQQDFSKSECYIDLYVNFMVDSSWSDDSSFLKEICNSQET